jgi:hypothetical protein
MRSHHCVLMIVLFLLAVPSAIRAQDMPGYTLQEIVVVPVTGTSVSSQTTLLQGVQYKLRALGSAPVTVPGQLGNIYRQGDAEYGFDFSGIGFPFFPASTNNCPIVENVDVGLAINNVNNLSVKSPFWGAYNPEHIYTVDFTGLGAPISINYHDCVFTANDGVLTVEIFRPMGMTLAIGQPTITNVSPGIDTFAASTQHSVSGRANALAVTADGLRLYAGTFAGVWRSDDGGLIWQQMTRPQPAPGVNTVAGSLLVPDVYDIAISPTNRDVVIVSVEGDLHQQPMNGIYRSEDAGSTLTLVKQFTCSGGGQVPQIVFAPDDANLVYAAGGCAVGLSADGGKTWKEKTLPVQASMSANSSVWHIAVAPLEPPENKAVRVTGSAIDPLGVRRVYALGGNQMFYSTDGGQTWTADSGINTIVNLANIGDPAAPNSGNSSRVLMVEPGNNQHVLLSVNSLANGPSYYDKPVCDAPTIIPDGITCNATVERHCGEGSIWLGDFSAFFSSAPSPQAAWTQLPGPPVYWGITTPSGNTYVNVKPVGNNYLLFFADRSHVHVSTGLPVKAGWHRIEGLDASQTAPPNPPNPYCNKLFVHVDPHALVMTPNFSMTLQPPPAAAPKPFKLNKVAGPNTTGDLWMANDGGVFHSSGALTNWRPASNLSTLATVNLAGLAVPGYSPALYFGTGDNDDFYSSDGGGSWRNPQYDCGDCDAWFADPAQVRQVMEFMPSVSGGGFFVFTNSTKYPDPEPQPPDNTQLAHWFCPTDCNASSSFWIRGYRPMVLTPAGTDAPATGDYVIIGTRRGGNRVVFRKTNAEPIATSFEWDNTNKALQYGPVLPSCGPSFVADCIDVVQASGGHTAPVVYVGDPATGPNENRLGNNPHAMTLWKWAPGMQDWQQLVPSPPLTPPGKKAAHARRFYVDPYNPNTIYLLDDDAVKRSDDGGATWTVDVSLDNAITEGHAYSYRGDFAVIKDIIFVRGEDQTRFAVGNAGVFYTLDGTNWARLLSTSALPSHPVSAYFDGISDPCDRALYVGLDGRGILRIDPIPPPGKPVITGIHPCSAQEANKTKQ